MMTNQSGQVTHRVLRITQAHRWGCSQHDVLYASLPQAQNCVLQDKQVGTRGAVPATTVTHRSKEMGGKHASEAAVSLLKFGF
jgi:hypothetical protein